MRYRIPALLIAAGATLVLAAGTASASTTGHATTVTKNGDYSFASDTYDYSPGGTFRITAWPQTHSDSSQALDADGNVDLATTPGSSGYADSGVIVDLGDLDSLFSDGNWLPPVIAGSPNLGVNLYLDTNGTDTYGTINASDVWTGEDGNNYASFDSAADLTSGTLDFTTFAGEPGADTAFATEAGFGAATSVSAVLAAYTAEYGHYGVKTADPQVYAWIGISGSSAQTGYVTSVDGTPLVTVTTPAPALLYWHANLHYFTLGGKKHAEPSGFYRIGGLNDYWHARPAHGKPYFTRSGKRRYPGSGVAVKG